MTEAELRDHIRAHYPRENARCEWKAFRRLHHAMAGDAGDDVISYVSAIANMEGGALVLGVSDALEVAGIEDPADYTPTNAPLRLLGRCPHLLSEGLHVEEHVATDSGRVVWILHIPKHAPRLPVLAHNRAWQRVEDSLVEMRPERRDAILREPVDGVDWSAGIVDGATLADLDADAVALARTQYATRHAGAAFAGEIPGWDLITLLDRAKFTIGGRVTRTALLLLGRPESAHHLPGTPQITWKLLGEESAYEHFGPPFLLATTAVLRRIRNIQTKLFPENELLAVEVSKYDTRVILEALHNCIAHQDYQRGERIVVTERVDRLVFESAGGFFDGSPDDYVLGERTPRRYRNPWLSQAMVNVGMIDTAGYGIHTMAESQRRRFFPLPDYAGSTPTSVQLTIFGHAIDPNYTQLLMERRDLPLTTVMLLDRIQKKEPVSDEAAAMLRQAGLIEGRKPKYYVSARVASATGGQSEYVRNRAFNDDYYKDLVLAYIDEFGGATRPEIDRLLIDKLSDALTEQQKRNKVRNLLGVMARTERTIVKAGGRRKGRWVRRLPEQTEP